MRLINADGLMRGLELYGEKKVYADVVMELIKQTPTIDAVEVVRCKDCKWRKINRKSGTFNCGHEYGMITAKDDNFCNYGERREE